MQRRREQGIGYQNLQDCPTDNDDLEYEGLSPISRGHEILLSTADYWREHPPKMTTPGETNAREAMGLNQIKPTGDPRQKSCAPNAEASSQKVSVDCATQTQGVTQQEQGVQCNCSSGSPKEQPTPDEKAQDQQTKRQGKQTPPGSVQLVRLPRGLTWKRRADQHWLAQMFQLAAEMEAEEAGDNIAQIATKTPL